MNSGMKLTSQISLHSTQQNPIIWLEIVPIVLKVSKRFDTVFGIGTDLTSQSHQASH